MDWEVWVLLEGFAAFEFALLPLDFGGISAFVVERLTLEQLISLDAAYYFARLCPLNFSFCLNEARIRSLCLHFTR